MTHARSEIFTANLVKTLRAFAIKHRRRGNWIVATTWTDEQFIEAIGNATTHLGAINSVRRRLEHQAD